LAWNACGCEGALFAQRHGLIAARRRLGPPTAKVVAAVDEAGAVTGIVVETGHRAPDVSGVVSFDTGVPLLQPRKANSSRRTWLKTDADAGLVPLPPSKPEPRPDPPYEPRKIGEF